MALDILLVDDDRDSADILAQSLRDDGHQVHLSRDAASGVAVAAELQPDVVVVDLALAGADGCTVAQSLRRALPERTPIIVLSRHPTPALAEVDLVLNKPVEYELFGGLVEYVRWRRLYTTKPVGASR